LSEAARRGKRRGKKREGTNGLFVENLEKGGDVLSLLQGTKDTLWILVVLFLLHDLTVGDLLVDLAQLLLRRFSRPSRQLRDSLLQVFFKSSSSLLLLLAAAKSEQGGNKREKVELSLWMWEQRPCNSVEKLETSCGRCEQREEGRRKEAKKRGRGEEGRRDLFVTGEGFLLAMKVGQHGDVVEASSWDSFWRRHLLFLFALDVEFVVI